MFYELIGTSLYKGINYMIDFSLKLWFEHFFFYSRFSHSYMSSVSFQDQEGDLGNNGDHTSPTNPKVKLPKFISFQKY